MIENTWLIENYLNVINSLDTEVRDGIIKALCPVNETEKVVEKPITNEYYESRIKELESIIADLTKPKRVSLDKNLESVFNNFLTKKRFEQSDFASSIFIHDGVRYACDGHRILKTPLPIDIKTNDVVNGQQKYVPAECGEKLKKMIDDLYKELDEKKDCFELPEYTVFNELYKNAKQPKAKRYIYTFKFHDKYYCYDAKYLLDGMKAVGTNKLLVNTKPNFPSLMVGEVASYLVLPVNNKEATDERVGKIFPIF